MFKVYWRKYHIGNIYGLTKLFVTPHDNLFYIINILEISLIDYIFFFLVRTANFLLIKCFLLFDNSYTHALGITFKQKIKIETYFIYGIVIEYLIQYDIFQACSL